MKTNQNQGLRSFNLFLMFMLLDIFLLSNCDKKESELDSSITGKNDSLNITIQTLSRAQITNSSRPIINDSTEFFGIYHKYVQSNIIEVTAWNPGCVSRSLYIEELNYSDNTFLKVKGFFNSDPNYGENGFTTISTEDIDIPSIIREMSDSIIITYSDTLSKIDYTTLLGTGTEIYFPKDSIISSVDRGEVLLDSKGIFLHTIYEGPKVNEGFATHFPYIDFVYNLETEKIEKLLVYVYGYASE